VRNESLEFVEEDSPKMEYDYTKVYGKEFDAIIKRISTHPGVIGVIVTQNCGTPIYSTMDNNKTYIFSQKLWDFAKLSRSVIRQIDPEDDLEVVRIKTLKYEIMSATPTATHSIVTIQQVKPPPPPMTEKA